MKKTPNTKTLIERYQKNGMLQAFEENFLKYIPGNYEFAKEHHFSENWIEGFLLVDRFIFSYRRYLIGQLTTLHRPIKYLKALIAHDSEIAFESICLEVDLVDRIIDQHEFYELLDRYYYSNNQISKLLKPIVPWIQKK